MREVFDFIWPTLERSRPEGDDGSDEIRKADFSGASALALQEARRIEAREEDRKKTADAKASNFLLVAAALVPLLTYLETAVWDGKVGTAPKWLTLTILAASVLYLGRAVLWALAVVRVGAYHTVGERDLIKIFSGAAPAEVSLVREILVANSENQNRINEKVSAVKMAHLFMARAIVGFCALLLVQAIAELEHETYFSVKFGAWFKFALHAMLPACFF